MHMCKGMFNVEGADAELPLPHCIAALTAGLISENETYFCFCYVLCLEYSAQGYCALQLFFLYVLFKVELCSPKIHV